jgi:flagellar protein FliL
MASDENDGEEKKEKPSGGGKKKLIIIILAVLILVGGGVGAFLAMGGKGHEGDEESSDGEEAEEEAEHEEEAAPAFVQPLEPFIVNLQVKGSFLKTTIQLRFSTPEPPPHIENEIPKVRDSVIRILTGKAASDILSAEGKETLREEIRDAVNEALGGEDVTEIYFTEFIVQ